MSLTSTSNRVVATGDGVTVTFYFNRLVYDANHLQVYLDSILQASGYTVNGVPGTSTSVTFTVAPANGVQVVLLRVVPLTQLSVYAVGGAFPAATTEKNFDLAMMASQQFDDTTNRTLRQPVGDAVNVSELPAAADRALKYLAFDASGDPVASSGTTSSYVVTPFAETLLDDTTASAARATLGLDAIPDSQFRIAGSADATKKIAFEVDGLTTGTTRTVTMPDQDFTISQTWNGVQDFRLSLTTGVPVTTSDVTAAGTLYAVPYVGNRIALYDGTTWKFRTSAQFSLALTLTSGKPYDVFCYDNAGTPTLEVLVWTNDTTRATALAYQDGILVKSGATTRRYLGTLYASGANTTEDSEAKRYLWNYYHRVNHRQLRTFSTNRTTVSTSFAELNTEIRAEFVIGVAEDSLLATWTGGHQQSGLNSTLTALGINGLTALGSQSHTFGSSGPNLPIGVSISAVPGVGYSYVTALAGVSAGTATFYSADNVASGQAASRLYVTTRG